MALLKIPTQQELHDEYRHDRYMTTWGGCRKGKPDIFTFSSNINGNRTYYCEKAKIVILQVDASKNEIYYDGIRNVTVPSVESLNDGVFAALASVAPCLVVPIDLFMSDYFVKTLVDNRGRFRAIFIHHPLKVDIEMYNIDRIYKSNWHFRPKHKATSSDVKKEFKLRLKEAYLALFGYGLGLTLCVVTSPMGLLMVTVGAVGLPIDAIVTGIRYSMLKHDEKLKQ